MIRGKYRILSKVGQGGMGAVYKALHVAFDELRALKVISRELISDQLFVKRFKHEAVITRRLQHPNAVRVDDIDEAEDGRPFIVMEYIEGQSLKKLIQEEGAIPVPRVCSIVKQVAAALEAAHRLGMVHRDIKPDNIVLVQTPQGEQAKVLDFGIAKIKEGRLGDTAGMTLTGTGVVIGTPQYMSPEQAMGKRGDELDGRSDLYSLGVVMYQMLSGDLPFKADTTMEMLLAHLQKLPAPIRTLHPELQIPEALASVVMSMLEKKPESRPRSARALIEQIELAERATPSPGATRVVQPQSVYSPRAAQELEAALRARAAGAGRGAAAPAGPGPAAGVGAVPAEVAPRPPVVERPVAPLRVAPAPPVAKERRWGLWAAMAILAVAVGGGAWYFVWWRVPSGPKPTVTLPSPPPVPPRPPSAASSATSTQGASASGSGSTPSSVPSADTRRTSTPSPVPLGHTAPRPAGRSAPAVPVSRPAPGATTAPPIRQFAPPTPSIDTRAVGAALSLGNFFFDRGEYDKAIEEYQKGLRLDPTNRDLRSRLNRAQKARDAEARVLQ